MVRNELDDNKIHDKMKDSQEQTTKDHVLWLTA